MNSPENFYRKKVALPFGLLAHAFQQGPNLFKGFLADVTGVSLSHATVYDMRLIVNSL